ncbi:MAG: hypothetical protein ACAI25_21035 [Planctomycetota bacterium]
MTSKGFGTFQIICAWCGRVESRPAAAPEGKTRGPQPASPISHTICEKCFVKERAEVERVVQARRKRSSA